MQWLIDRLIELDVSHDVEEDWVSFIADNPYSALFIEALQWDEPGIGMQVGFRAETMPLERLGRVGDLLGEHPHLRVDVDLLREDDQSQACLEFLIEVDPRVFSYLDQLYDFLDHVERVLGQACEDGATFGVDFDGTTDGFAELLLAEQHDKAADPAVALQPLKTAIRTFERAGLTDYQCVSLTCEADLHALVGATKVAHDRLQRAEALLAQTRLTSALRRQISTVRLRVLVAEERWSEADSLLTALYEDPEFDIEDPTWSHALEASHLLSRAMYGVGDSADFFTNRARNLEPNAAPKARALIEFNSGGAMYETGDITGAAAAFERAAELYAAAGATHELVQAQMTLVIVYAMLEVDHRRANELFDRYVHLITASTSKSSISIARSAAAALGRPTVFGIWDAGESDPDQARMAKLNQAIGSFHKSDFWSARILATEALGDEYIDYGGFPDAIDTRIRASALQLRSWCSVLETLKTGKLPSQPEIGRALEDALASTRLFFQEQRLISTANTRNSWIESFGRSYFSAIFLSMMREEHRIVLAILELVRAHEVEVEITAETFGEQDAAGPVDPFEIVEVQVQDFSLGVDGCAQVAIEDVMAAQVDLESYYWSQWLFGPCLVWSLRVPGGQVDSGYIILDEAPLPSFPRLPAPSADLEFVKDCERFAAFHRGERVELGEPERVLAAKLGQRLIPDLLREHLLQTDTMPPTILFTPGEPVADFPTVLLALDGNGTRLLDRANLQIAAPAAATLRTSDHRATPVTPTLVIDPTDQMHLLRELRRSDADGRDGVHRFWECARERGDFVFAGHAVPQGRAEAEGLGLRLELDNVLLPAEILSEGPNGVPDRIVLAGCSTSDLPSRGVHRSWTLPSIFLGLGSTEVVTARQRLRANEDVAEITAHLIRSLQSSEPLGEAVHAIQRDFLSRHRTDAGDLPPAGQWASWATHRLMGRRD